MMKRVHLTLGTLLLGMGALPWNADVSRVRAAEPNDRSFASQLGVAHRASTASLTSPSGIVVRGQQCGCGGAGCGMCGGGYYPGGSSGWQNAPNCMGCQANGYPPGAAPYPFPWNGDPGMAMGSADAGYLNMGDTCSGPDWFDLMFEGVVLTRVSQTSTALQSDGIRGFGAPNTVLSTDSADFDYGIGYRATGRFQCSAATALEAIYLGGLDWDNQASATSNINSLYSVFSDFGNTPFGGFEETDQATTASVEVDAELDSLEVNYRRGWISPHNRAGGAWFLGCRWIRFKDALRYQTNVVEHVDPTVNPPTVPPTLRPDANFDYSIAARNDLVGPQLGTDMTFCLFPSMMLGGDAKVALYGNTHEQASEINAFTAPNNTGTLSEFARDTSVSYGSEGHVYLIWQFHPMMKFRTGYEVLFVDRVATAAGNFNTQAPFVANDPRTVDVDDNDQLLLHGFDVGFEFGW